PSASAPSRRRTNAPRLSSSPPTEPPPRGSRRSSAIRALPRHENNDDVTNGASRVGASSWKPSGSGCSRPRNQTKTLRKRSSVRTSRSSTPSRRQSASAHGFSDRNESGPASTRKPSARSVTMVPPSRRRASTTRTSRSTRRSRASSIARAAAPALVREQPARVSEPARDGGRRRAKVGDVGRGGGHRARNRVRREDERCALARLRRYLGERSGGAVGGRGDEVLVLEPR